MVIYETKDVPVIQLAHNERLVAEDPEGLYLLEIHSPFLKDNETWYHIVTEDLKFPIKRSAFSVKMDTIFKVLVRRVE